MRRDALVFDFFGVICSEIAPFWLQKYFRDDDAIRLKATVVHSADTGEISQDDMFQRLAKLANLTPVQIEREWFGYAHIDSKVVEFIRSASGIYKVGLLTNSPSKFVRDILHRERLSDLFEAIVVSSEIGSAKPSPRSYEAILNGLDVTAPQAVMIDDNPVNVAAAEALGMRSILFKTLDSLKEIQLT